MDAPGVKYNVASPDESVVGKLRLRKAFKRLNQQHHAVNMYSRTTLRWYTDSQWTSRGSKDICVLVAESQGGVLNRQFMRWVYM